MPRGRWLLTVSALTAVLLLCTLAVSAQWQQANDDGFGVGCNTTASLVVFNDVLYAGAANPGGLFRLGNPTDPTRFWWFDVDLPIEEVPGVPASPVIGSIPAMKVFSGPSDRWPWLYVAVNVKEDESGGARVSFVLRSQDGHTWGLASEVWGFDENGEIVALAVFEGRLYVSLGDTTTRDRARMALYRTDGRTWETVPTGSLRLGEGEYCFGVFETHDGDLYAGASGFNECPECDRTAEVWRSEDGWRWTRHAQLHSATMAEVKSIASHGGHLYVGTKNHPGEGEEFTGPELWRVDGDEPENLSAERQPFVRQAVHLDVLCAYHGVLYAATGGAQYTRVYRSPDGESWEQITPAGIRNHPGDDNYLTGAMVGVGEYLFLGTGLNQEAGTEVWRLATLRSDVGPCLAQHDGEAYLLHRVPRPAENVSETVFRDDVLLALGPIHDQNVARHWAFTNKQPVAYGYDFMGLLVGSRYLQLVYRGHSNASIWHTRKSCLDGSNWYWETPASIPDSRTNRAPGATAHNWSGPTGPQLTVAYTDPDTGRIHFRVKEGSGWSAEYTLPEAARTSNGPEIVSFRDSLYVFYRGYGDDNRLYVARKTSNRASHTGWEISQLPRAFTRPSGTDRAVSAAVYDGALVVAYVGHNNDYLWLRRSTDGANWDRLGYIRGPVSDHNPDLAVVGETLYLAFKPVGDQEVCFGTLELDEENEHDTAGHVWRSLRPMSCCPGCILTILDVIIPLRPPSDDD